MKALVIDDSRAMRTILSHMLSQLGFEVQEAANGRAGFELIEQTPNLDLALVDWNMPEMNGLELVRRVRADNKFDDVRLVMVTTETEMAQVIAAIEAGATEYVMKPFTKEVILQKLQFIGLLPDHATPTS